MAEVQEAGRQSQLKIGRSNNWKELKTSPNEAYGMVEVQGACFNAERQIQFKMKELKTSPNEAYGMVEVQGACCKAEIWEEMRKTGNIYEDVV